MNSSQCATGTGLPQKTMHSSAKLHFSTMTTLLTRQQFLQVGAAALATSLIRPPGAEAQTPPSSKGTSAMTTQQWDKTFPKSDKIDHQKVSFKNRYGITLSADLYLPKARNGRKLAALAISGPFGAVKEQSSGLYAQTMAERGYVALAFDPSFTGESGGETRNLPSPEINTEDFSAAVDYLGLQTYVDRERVGAIGICGFAGMILSQAAIDKRIKAVVTTSMYDMSRVMSQGYYDKMTLQERSQALTQMSLQRWADMEKGSASPGARILPEKLDGVTDPVLRMYFDYYRTPRGFHVRSPNSNGAWTATGPMPFMNLPLLTHISEIAPRPILLIAGEKAHSRYFSEDAFKAAGQSKELVIIPGANHVDLYDRVNVIPFDKIVGFFDKHLA